ncbi:MAG TPA: hypothetical protein DCK85_04670 [Ktedonobacter sp.]|jgi:hypothetical protein|nr:hypothetical protein [Ktedonobacter sp.]
MTEAQLEYAQKHMQQKWFDLAMAEQRGVAFPILERMYNGYVLAMEEYNRRSEEYQREMQAETEGDPHVVKQNRAARSKALSSPKEGEHTKMAS